MCETEKIFIYAIGLCDDYQTDNMICYRQIICIVLFLCKSGS